MNTNGPKIIKRTVKLCALIYLILFESRILVVLSGFQDCDVVRLRMDRTGASVESDVDELSRTVFSAANTTDLAPVYAFNRADLVINSGESTLCSVGETGRPL